MIFNITSPSNIFNFFGNWLNRVAKKDKGHISVWKVLRIPRGPETFQPPGPGADTCPIWTPNPGGCCNGAKICRSEQKNCIILAKKYFYLNPAGCCNRAKTCRSEQKMCVFVAKNIPLLLLLYYCSKIKLCYVAKSDFTKYLVAKLCAIIAKS
jgi:hypothetical protein